MKITPKSSERLFAQTAAYVEHVTLKRPLDVMRREIGGIATALLAGKEYIASDGRVLNPEGYHEFLSSMDSESHADIVFHASKIGPAYLRFEDQVETVIKRPQRAKLLGKGAQGSVFAIRDEGDNVHVLKNGGIDTSVLGPFRKAEGITGLAHLEAIDTQRGLAIMDLVPGRPMTKMSFSEQREIPIGHIKELVDKVAEVHKAGITLDHGPDNFFYDSTVGFGIVDYYGGPVDGQIIKFGMHDLVHQIISLDNVLTYNPDDDLPTRLIRLPGEKSSRDKKAQMNLRDIDLLGKFLDVLENYYPDVLASARESNSLSVIKKIARNLPNEEPYVQFKERVREISLNESFENDEEVA
jgi:hypothetical protein